MSSLSAERSRERKGTETIGEQMSRKYTGDRPWMQSYVISAILNVMRWDTGSQWRVSRNVGVMWSFRRTPVINQNCLCQSPACILVRVTPKSVLTSTSNTQLDLNKLPSKRAGRCHCGFSEVDPCIVLPAVVYLQHTVHVITHYVYSFYNNWHVIVCHKTYRTSVTIYPKTKSMNGSSIKFYTKLYNLHQLLSYLSELLTPSFLFSCFIH